MLTRQIDLEHGITVGAINISETNEIQEALTALNIPHPRNAIVLVGGAGGIRDMDQFPMRKAVGIVAQLAEETNSVVIDGGTQAGIMTEIGLQRQQKKYTFPLVGVVFDSLIMQETAASILDANHTHFMLIPGNDWGAESSWISRIATVVSNQMKSITVLVNGGNISRSDVEYSLLENRPTCVMRGTGRLANDITIAGKVFAIDISTPSEEILEILREKMK